jgi:hypothetical protein
MSWRRGVRFNASWPGFVPAIHVFDRIVLQPGMKPGMTIQPNLISLQKVDAAMYWTIRFRG